MSKTKVVILCGGMGTRLGRETEYRPKPMVEIGNKPILWHIMKIYAHYGFKDFVLCLGYKGDVIRNYFLNYLALNSDFTINLGRREFQICSEHSESDWNVALVDTGLKAMTGARLKRVEKYIDTDPFMLTYGDGVANIDIGRLLKFHKSHNNLGTVTGVLPTFRFGELDINGDRVMNYSEKSRSKSKYVNGGFFVFSRGFFKYLSDEESCVLEKEPLENLAKDGELMVYKHKDFWQCLDTKRELSLLNQLWNSNDAPWKVWK